MASVRSSRAVRYGVAVVAVAAAVGLRLGLQAILPVETPYLLFFAAVMVAAWYGGLGPGLLATGLGMLASNFFFVAPLHQFSLGTPGESLGLILFLAEGIFISLLSSDLLRARSRVEAAAVEARELQQRLLEVADGEQVRIGHDLHDGIGQHLTGIAFLAKALEQRLRSRGTSEAPQAEQLGKLVNEAIGLTRSLAEGLSPVVLETGGLSAALGRLAENAGDTLGIRCVFEHDERAGIGELPVATHLYRIAQEAVSNAARHGRAGTVRIGLRREGRGTVLEVIDNGRGFSQARADGGMGLRIMRYRANMIGGTLEIRAEPAGGTLVRCVLPAQQDEARPDRETNEAEAGKDD